MNGSMDGSDGYSDTREDPRPPTALETVVVRYERRPDRRTLSPSDDWETRTAWLTADVDAFVNLEDAR